MRVMIKVINNLPVITEFDQVVEKTVYSVTYYATGFPKYKTNKAHHTVISFNGIREDNTERKVEIVLSSNQYVVVVEE